MSESRMNLPTDCPLITGYSAVVHAAGKHPDANFKAVLTLARGEMAWPLEKALIIIEMGEACPVTQLSDLIGAERAADRAVLPKGRIAIRLTSGWSRVGYSASFRLTTCSGGASLVPTITCPQPRDPTPPPPTP